MEKANQVAARALAKSTPKTEKPQDSIRAMTVWVQLAEMFGQAFYREHQAKPPSLWVQAINRLSDGQIREGLANIANDGLSFPPNLPQFVAACKRPKPAEAPYWNRPLQIEDQRPSGRMPFSEWKKKNGVE